MRFGVALPQFGPPARDAGGARAHPRRRGRRRPARLRRRVDRRAPHLSAPIATPYPVRRKFPFDVSDPVLDVAATLAYVAAPTTRVRLGTSVIVLPYHHPIALAKALATVDVLSNGRAARRRRRAAGCARSSSCSACRFASAARAPTSTCRAAPAAVDARSAVTFRGRFFSLDDAVFFPKPRAAPASADLGGRRQPGRAAPRRAGSATAGSRCRATSTISTPACRQSGAPPRPPAAIRRRIGVAIERRRPLRRRAARLGAAPRAPRRHDRQRACPLLDARRQRSDRADGGLRPRVPGCRCDDRRVRGSMIGRAVRPP